MDKCPGLPGYLDLVTGEIGKVLDGIDEAAASPLVERIRHARRIYFVGAGRSGLVLKMAAMRLMHLGFAVHVVGETTTPAIEAGDLLIAASGSGTTSTVVKAASTAAGVGASVVSYTTDPTSSLAGLSDHVLVIAAARKTDHGAGISRQYSGSLFEQTLLLVTEAVFQILWDIRGTPAEELWPRHANLE
ncbi:6-phospho-3-hexuloisomerase [Pseudarthrobacter sp. S9]|uniref:6-phospho-3-hexuloisomerase n=1 Tax=Pseudarthrobacter sp. S9 TaxID=3418421 RepID=UPI003CFEF1FD